MNAKTVSARVAAALVYANPIAFVPAFALRPARDVSIAPNFVVLGLLGGLVAAITTLVIRARSKHWSRLWAGAMIANLAVVVIALGAIDFTGLSGGGH
ncbi:MAG: hypothetical protein KDC98_03870 [Planctomycetes bacterium]|nr:hypothetical protein [Planctomycetota bacterium]